MSKMTIKFCALLAAIPMLCLISGQVQATTVSLNPLTQNVALGNQVSLQLNMDFSGDPTLGGGVDILYNSSLLSFVSFTFDPGLGDDPDFQLQPDVLLNELNGLAFGSFDGIEGPSLVGTLIFDTIGAGLADLTLVENTLSAGGFYSATSFDPQLVTFTGASVNVMSASVTSVPEPSTAWLSLGGLAVLIGMRKKMAV